MNTADTKKISIITVVYNDKVGLEKTILSVISQSYHYIEYVVVDGGSTDGTLEVIKKYSDKITKWISEPDRGIYDAMNKGINLSSGQWLNFMNAGDTFYTNMTVEQVVPLLKETPIVYGKVLRISERSSFVVKGITTKNPHIYDFLNSSFQHQACFINRILFDKYGGYSTYYRLASDSKFFFDTVAINHEKVKYIDKIIAIFQLNGASSRAPLIYKEEREDFLKKELGEEIYGYIKELRTLKNCRLAIMVANLEMFIYGIVNKLGIRKCLSKIRAHVSFLINKFYGKNNYCRPLRN